jgi:hypothetical protein
MGWWLGVSLTRYKRHIPTSTRYRTVATAAPTAIVSGSFFGHWSVHVTNESRPRWELSHTMQNANSAMGNVRAIENPTISSQPQANKSNIIGTSNPISR